MVGHCAVGGDDAAAELEYVQLPVFYLPLVWLGVVGTALTYAMLALAEVDVQRILASLRIRGEFTFAVCVYGAWTLAAALTLWFLLLRDGFTPTVLGLEAWPSLGDFVLAVVGAVLAIRLWPLVRLAAQSVDGASRVRRLFDRKQAGGSVPWDFVLLTLVGALLVPVIEEYIFRGYVVTALDRRVSTPIVILVSSAVFASVHVALGPGAVAYAFFLALMLSGLFLFSGSLYPPMLMHSIVNFLGFVAAPVLWGKQRCAQRGAKAR